MTREEYWYWMCNIKEVTRKDIDRLMKVYGDPEAVYKAREEELRTSVNLDAKTARAVVLSRNNFRNLYRLDKMQREGIQFIYYGSESYPDQLMHLEDRPYALYVKGKLPDPEFPSAGIVGARNCSGYGKEMALRFSQTLAANSVQIISGMAAGIDAYASQGAIEAGGKTFVILGCGVDVIYPAQNIELYYQIILNGGGVISEYPMGAAPVGWQFPYRNRLISAFSDKLLILEARKKSGTLSTAAHALAQGKDIYALPGRVTDPLSEGCNALIADGAGILTDPAFILEEFYGSSHKGTADFSTGSRYKGSDTKIRKIFEVLSYEPKTIDMIMEESGLSLDETASTLTEMELDGLCEQMSKDCYVKA